jgi:hypothetical protein
MNHHKAVNKPDSKVHPDSETVRLLEAAIAEFTASATVKRACCNKCSGIIDVERVGDDALSVRCPCGKFWGHIRGL